MRTLANKAKSSKRSVGPQPANTGPFATTPDGQVFISAAECVGRNLEGRPRFEGVLMTRRESRLARKVIDDAMFDAASKIAARMPKKGAAAASPKAKTPAKPKGRKSGSKPSAPSGSGEAS
ncbi:MAG: hypothetical protein HUU21_09025 [Polyangiaceae bacterium]|nr:hypothetical protein [Polyangiaceae bacterium]